MPDPTFMAAQSQTQNPPGQEQVPGPGNASAVAAPPEAPQAPTAFGSPTQTMGQIANIRDAVMSQFPNITNFDDPATSMSPSEKIGLFAMALHNPQGALAVIRGQQERHIERQKMAA